MPNRGSISCACMCKLYVVVEGERIPTCTMYECSGSQRSVTFATARFGAAEIEAALTACLGYAETPALRAQAAERAALLARGQKGNNWRVSVFHFRPSMIEFTDKTARFPRRPPGSRPIQIWPDVSPETVYARNQMVIGRDLGPREAMARQVPLELAPPLNRRLGKRRAPRYPRIPREATGRGCAGQSGPAASAAAGSAAVPSAGAEGPSLRVTDGTSAVGARTSDKRARGPEEEPVRLQGCAPSARGRRREPGAASGALPDVSGAARHADGERAHDTRCAALALLEVAQEATCAHRAPDAAGSPALGAQRCAG